MLTVIKKIFWFLSGSDQQSKTLAPVEHYATYAHTPSSPKKKGKSGSYQISYGWHKNTARKMKVGDYAILPKSQSAGLYQGIVSVYGCKSAKTSAVTLEGSHFRKVTRVK